LIVHEILSSYGRSDQEYEYDEICISDTMGTLKCHDFEYIVNGLFRFGISKTRISMHLHINSENALESKRILFACFRQGIYRFDVSTLSEGGCSVTMNANQMKPNMSYDFFQSVFDEYDNLLR
jgi:isopropylmalate/homocitrate/citramalate synthase